jgi:hypothetical protein
VVATNGSCLPTSVIARWVGGVKLELAVFIIACEEEGSAEGPGSSDLGVVLLDVADVDNDFLDRDTRSVFKTVVLNGYFRTCAYSLSKLMR